jgi:hypothetical protein
VIIRGRDVPAQTLIIAALGLAAVPLLALADPSANPFFPPCPFHAVTGWLCPGCGSTRAMHALLHGHLIEALQLNPLAVAAVPFVARHVVKGFFGRTDAVVSHMRPVYIRALAVAIALFGILRNLA